ncbi:hypothetical protein DJ013_00640 [Arcticibacterium luteifluviistationis]|uniref:Uncharacterized protein n=1 Tax=Arcticibacterium luteifluviistationis TaxID=1784714 RepID=A0A2Z4G6J2_9BACT|nr:hypothetical protein DJ013_00640 [Arcticibacterium luteifluviistationis]
MKEDSLNNPETNRKTEGIYPKWKLISTHIGRRSLATNLYGKYATPLIVAMTGHAREVTFLQYIVTMHLLLLNFE